QLSVSIKAQINSLANKNYNKDYDSFDCIVIYLPIDMMLIYAIDEDKNLLTYAFEKRIILATPMTIFPLLTTLKYMWDNYNTVKNITEIIDIVKNIYKSIGEVGGSLVKAQEFLTQATMVYNANIVPKTSELKNLGVAVEYKPYKTAKIKTDIISELPIVEAISSTIEKEFSNIES
nr:DNA recombination protein RmuC [Burkholderiales bacterium]